jgi:hypothetical protein
VDRQYGIWNAGLGSEEHRGLRGSESWRLVMNRFKYNLIMCGIFVSLYTIATMVLEFFEGNKITKILYYGLRSIGFG